MTQLTSARRTNKERGNSSRITSRMFLGTLFCSVLEYCSFGVDVIKSAESNKYCQTVHAFCQNIGMF